MQKDEEQEMISHLKKQLNDMRYTQTHTLDTDPAHSIVYMYTFRSKFICFQGYLIPFKRLKLLS